MTRLKVATGVALLLGLATGPSPASVAQTPEADAAPAEGSRLSRLQGSAYLGRNRQVVGATVLVQPKEDPSQVFLTTSDGKGRFRVEDLPDGSYRVEIRRLGLEPVVKDDVGLKFPFRSVVELPMRPSESEVVSAAGAPVAPGNGSPVGLDGQVVGRDGASLAEIRIRLVRSDGRYDPREVLSEAEGAFAIGGLEPGGWRLEATGVGFLPLRISLDLEADTSVRVALVPQPADYTPSPLELMPPEEPVAPEALQGSLPDY